MAHEIKNILFVCVWEGRGWSGRLTGEVIHLFQLCVWKEGKGEETGKVINLFQTALNNLANKYFILVDSSYCPLWCSGLSYERTRV